MDKSIEPDIDSDMRYSVTLGSEKDQVAELQPIAGDGGLSVPGHDDRGATAVGIS